MKQKSTKDNFIKNKSVILTGTGIAFFNIFFLTGTLQAIIALIFGVDNFTLTFNYLIFKPFFISQKNVTEIAYGVIYVFPFVFNLLLMEIGSSLLRKTTLSKQRFALIIFNLTISGYLIISVFYGAIISLLNPNSLNDWSQLMLHLKIMNNGRIVFMFAIILMLITYLQQMAKRILTYIN